MAHASGMAVVGQPAVEDVVAEVGRDVVAHPERAELDVGAGEALGHRDQVGLDTPVVDREPLAGAPEAGHDLVGDEQDAVTVTDLAQTLHVAVGRDEDPVRADDGLDDDGRDGLRALVHEDVLGGLQDLADRIRVLLAPAVEVRDADDARDARLGGPAPWVAGQRDRPGRAAVVGAVADGDLVAARVHPGDLDRVLVRLGAPVREEERVDVARRELGELGAQPRARLGRHERVGVGERRRLLRDGLDDALVAMADVRAHQLAVEVEVALALGRPEPAALGAGNGDRIDLRLGRPFEDRVALGQLDDLVAGHRSGRGADTHGFTSSRTAPRPARGARRNGSPGPLRWGAITPHRPLGMAGRADLRYGCWRWTGAASPDGSSATSTRGG